MYDFGIAEVWLPYQIWFSVARTKKKEILTKRQESQQNRTKCWFCIFLLILKLSLNQLVNWHFESFEPHINYIGGGIFYWVMLLFYWVWAKHVFSFRSKNFYLEKLKLTQLVNAWISCVLMLIRCGPLWVSRTGIGWGLRALWALLVTQG